MASQTDLLKEPDSAPVWDEFERIKAIQRTTAIVDSAANMYFFIRHSSAHVKLFSEKQNTILKISQKCVILVKVILILKKLLPA